jgi:hypothetical protein
MNHLTPESEQREYIERCKQATLELRLQEEKAAIARTATLATLDELIQWAKSWEEFTKNNDAHIFYKKFAEKCESLRTAAQEQPK